MRRLTSILILAGVTAGFAIAQDTPGVAARGGIDR